jgi:hypothetical protein
MLELPNSLCIEESGLRLVLQTPSDGPVRLLQFAPKDAPLDAPENLRHCFPLV